MGDKLAEPAQIGVAFSLITVGSFIMSVFFGRIFKVFKFALLPVAYILGAAGLFICYQGHSLTVFSIGLCVLGFGMGVVVPTTMSKLTSLVPYSTANKAVSLGFFGLGIGGFIQPMVFSLFSVPGRAPFLIGAIGMVVLAVAVFIADFNNPFYTVVEFDGGSQYADLSVAYMPENSNPAAKLLLDFIKRELNATSDTEEK